MALSLNPPGNASKSQRSVLSPLDSLTGSETPFGVLQYPVDIDNPDYGHFIMFHVVETVQGSGGATGVLGADPILLSLTSLGKTAAQADIINRGRKRIESTQNALKTAGAWTTSLISFQQIVSKQETVETIILYMPEKLTSSYAMEYQGEKMRIAAGVLSGGAAFYEKFMDIIGAGTIIDPSVKEQMRKDLATEVGMALSVKLIDQLGSIAGLNVGAGPLAERNLRFVANPHMQFLYRSVNQRTFEYTFNFVPRNFRESVAIDNIIRTFKYYSHPELLNNTGRFHGFPAEFDIQYISKFSSETGVSFQENDWLNRVGRCYLSDVVVDYAAAGTFSTFKPSSAATPEKLRGESQADRFGNPPTHVTLSLKFSELETLNRKHIQEGF